MLFFRQHPVTLQDQLLPMLLTSHYFVACVEQQGMGGASTPCGCSLHFPKAEWCQVSSRVRSCISHDDPLCSGTRGSCPAQHHATHILQPVVGLSELCVGGCGFC